MASKNSELYFDPVSEGAECIVGRSLSDTFLLYSRLTPNGAIGPFCFCS